MALPKLSTPVKRFQHVRYLGPINRWQDKFLYKFKRDKGEFITERSVTSSEWDIGTVRIVSTVEPYELSVEGERLIARFKRAIKQIKENCAMDRALR